MVFPKQFCTGGRILVSTTIYDIIDIQLYTEALLQQTELMQGQCKFFASIRNRRTSFGIDGARRDLPEKKHNSLSGDNVSPSETQDHGGKSRCQPIQQSNP